MKKKILVQEWENRHGDGMRDLFELIYDESGDEVVLIYHPADKKWTRPNTVCAKLKTTPNGIEISQDESNVELYFNEAENARILLNVYTKLYRKSCGIKFKKDRYINDLSELGPKIEGGVAEPKLRPFGDVISDLENVIQEMVSRHDLQWGDILNIVHGYLCVHNPEAQEEYTDGSGSPMFYYGANKQGVKL